MDAILIERWCFLISSGLVARPNGVRSNDLGLIMESLLAKLRHFRMTRVRASQMDHKTKPGIPFCARPHTISST